jgi:hypothetical protein
MAWGARWGLKHKVFGFERSSVRRAKWPGEPVGGMSPHFAMILPLTEPGSALDISVIA